MEDLSLKKPYEDPPQNKPVLGPSSSYINVIALLPPLKIAERCGLVIFVRIYTMSSSEDDGQSPSSPPLQLAQQPADILYAENEDLDSANDYLSDAPLDHSSVSQQSPQRASSASGDPATNQAAADDEPHEFLDTDSQDSTSLPSRPNKFTGPPSTWRNWTAPERDLAASVEQLQAKDLSIHLYNSFKLRHRYRLRSPDRQGQSPQGSKTNESAQWVPPKSWTAWPLPSDIVPKEHDERRWEDDDIPSELHHARLKRPGQQLQEMLVAQVLRKAKEEFREQQWEGEQQTTRATVRHPEHLQGRRHANGRFRAKQDNDFQDQKPVIMADDQRASEILRPTVQHMMTKLDGLLMGLHHARASYLAVEDSDSESRSPVNERPTSRGRPRKRKQKASSLDEDAGTSQDMPDYDGSDSGGSQSEKEKPTRKDRIQYARSSSRRSQSHNFRKRKGRLGLRDWSDVLGIAAMTGWQQNVVGSATARCATLFEEGIEFRTLEEGKEIQEVDVYLPNASPHFRVQHGQSDSWRAREGSNKRFAGAMVGAVHVDGFLQPIKGKKSWKYDKKQPKRRGHQVDLIDTAER